MRPRDAMGEDGHFSHDVPPSLPAAFLNNCRNILGGTKKYTFEPMVLEWTLPRGAAAPAQQSLGCGPIPVPLGRAPLSICRAGSLPSCRGAWL